MIESNHRRTTLATLLVLTATACAGATSAATPAAPSASTPAATPASAAQAPSAPLGVGSVAPDVTGADQNGSAVRLKDLRGQAVLVFFYPKAGTPGCTKEACAFRDVWQRYEKAGVRVVGVSHDTVADQAAFAREHGFKFPLVSDTEGTWGKAFGVPLRVWKFYSRISFLVGRDGRIAKTYLDVDPGVHAGQVLADAQSL
jgi:peroxiredoxin Q/BCP